jgi:tetratricopeptide (TPR) repeat protein
LTVFPGFLNAQKPPVPPQQQEQEPPEEDPGLKAKEYSFNPLQAQKELRVGNYYFKKGSYKAAANRFRESTKWDPTNAEAYFRLGESEEKLRDRKAAREAFEKYLELAPDGKDAPVAKRKLAAK